MECVTLIDISSEDDDLLFPSSSQGLGSETFSNLEAENIDNLSKQMAQLCELSESPQRNRGSDRYSLRKSLAWDSEFFTSEGVLNPEELAIYNSTYSKAIALKLPEIHEELRKSAESTSTLDSVSQAFENFELHLYGNLRASGKRTLVDSNQTANMEHPGQAKEQRKPDKSHLRSSKKLNISSQSKVASGNAQLRASNRLPEISSITPFRAVHGKSSSSLLNKQIKTDRGKVLSGTTPKRRAGMALNKSNNDLAITSRPIPSKESSLRTPQSGFKSASSSFALSNCPASSSSHSSSSRLALMRNSMRNNIPPPSSFSSKTPSKTKRSITGSKNQICISSLGNSTLLFSKLSPSSSMDSLLSESSSQTSSSTKHSNSLKGGTLSQSFTVNHSKTTSKFDFDPKGAISIGLRMPRPRIGYFDKEKTLFHGSNKHLQTSLTNGLAKSNGISDTSAVIKRGYQIILKDTAKHQQVFSNLQKESSPKTSEGNCKKSSKNKIEHPNLLQPKSAVMENGIHERGELRTKQENLQSELSSSEKENLPPDSEKGKVLRTEEDQNSSTVRKLEGMVSSLSLSEVRDLNSRD